MSVEMVLRDVRERHEFVNAGVVYQNIDPAKRFRRGGKEPGHFRFLGNIALHRDSFSAVLGDLIYHLVRIALERGIVTANRGAFSREPLCDTSADSLRRTRYNRNF